MNPRTVLAATAVCVGSFAATVAALQNIDALKTRQRQIQANVLEPAKLEPTDARVASLKLPPGFRIAKFAQIENPRWLVVGADGTVYASQRVPGTLTMLKDTDGDGVADVQKIVAKKEDLHGLAIHDGKMFFATVHEVFVADIEPDGTLGEPRQLIGDLPDAGQHANRTLAFGPDGKMYVSVGSTCNVCKEPNPENATLLRADPDGKNRTIFASGLRNTIGFDWHPVSKRLFGMDHGIDWLGDDDPPEELNEIVENARYGWPYVYGNSKFYPRLDPPDGRTKETWAKQSREPLLTYTSHSAPLQWSYYTGSQFPAEYKNDAFVAMRGSWNRKPPSGYEVVRIRFTPQGTPRSIEPFLTGFGSAAGQFARLVGVAVAKDGALLVGDDTNNTIYRVSYEGRVPQRPNWLSDAQRKITSRLDGFTSAPKTITVRSESFGDNQPIPDRHSNYGDDQSPALAWSGVPAGAKSVVLMMEDPDALSPKPAVHWLIADVPPNVTSLPANLPKDDKPSALGGGKQGGTVRGNIGYYGPMPPGGDGPHHYHFQVFALDTMLPDLPSGFNRVALLKAMRGHVLSWGEINGTYRRE